MPGNPFQQLNNLYTKVEMLPGELSQLKHLTPEDKKLLQRIGLTTTQVKRDLLEDVQIQYDRMSLYHQVERALEHPLVGSAAELYGNATSVFSPLHNATVWITSESPTYQRELTKLLDRIGIEEKIFDWAYTTGTYGDMFVKINGIPGKGILSIKDDEHPLNISRVDHEGILVGFYKTPLGQVSEQQKLQAPWEYVHFRLLGGKKKRPRFGDPKYSEFRSMHLLTGMDVKQVTTKYGTSLLLNALPSYRRLRLAEDSLLLARLSRGLIRYIWKLKVSGCFRGNTQISLMDGTNPTIKEMADDPETFIGKSVLTVNEKTKHLEPKKIKNAKKTHKNVELVRVHLDNGKYIDCTSNHRFMLRDGSYREVQDLKPNDSLMPYYWYISEKERDVIEGYRLVYDPGDDRYHREHRIAVGKLEKGQIPHHVDFNKLNNDPSNFRISSSQSEHIKFHHEHSKKYGWAITGSKPKTKEHSRKVVESRRANGGPWHSKETRAKISKAHQIEKEVRICAYDKCDNTFEVIPSSNQRYCSISCNNKSRMSPRETRVCACGKCGETFECAVTSKQRYIYGHHMYGKTAWNIDLTKETDERVAKQACKGEKNGMHIRVEREIAQPVESLINHKVVQVEWLNVKEDVYDLEIEDTPNFPLTAGVFVHNSNMEAVGELVDQYSRVLREARALNTRDTEANFESKENPMSCIEDIFLPVWGDTGDLTFDKIGGEADIRWIRDIEDLRQQLAAALRVPLQLLGAYLKEATGPLGNSAMEKLDINFARIARKLQRTVRTGIKRICQIHLAYMNMDPDPSLFDVQMAEMSTAEEESLKDSLSTGMDIVSSMMDTVDKAIEGGDRQVDKIEIFNYLNEKILKLEDFDLKEFIISKEALPECKRRRARMDQEQKIKALLEKAITKADGNRTYRKPPLFSMDLLSYVPTTIYKEDGAVDEKIMKKVSERGGWLGVERSSEVWESKFGNSIVIEDEFFDEDIVTGKQLALPFKKDK